MKTGIQLTVDWYDEDVVGLSVAASNGSFSGMALVYAPLDFAKELASTLAGFPTRPGDRRTLELGTFEAGYAGGGARLVFHTLDGAGHPAVEVAVQADVHHGPPGSATVFIELESARIDDFVLALDHMDLERGATVRLVAAQQAVEADDPAAGTLV